MADKTDIPETTLPQSPLERAARALAEALYAYHFNARYVGGERRMTVEQLRDATVPESSHDLLEVARAVLQAIREPSEAMIAAGVVHSNTPNRWQAMIDAALEEG